MFIFSRNMCYCVSFDPVKELLCLCVFVFVCLHACACARVYVCDNVFNYRELHVPTHSWLCNYNPCSIVSGKDIGMCILLREYMMEYVYEVMNIDIV